jgi:hypothetical protein
VFPHLPACFFSSKPGSPQDVLAKTGGTCQARPFFFVVLIHLNKNPDEFQATTRRTLMIFRGLNPAFL